MEHPHFQENEFLSVSDIQGVSGLNHMKIPAPLAILPLNAFHRIFRTINRHIRNLLQNGGKRAGMVALPMICHNEINLFQINFFFQILHKVKTVGCPNRIHQNRLFFLDEIGILAGTINNGIIISMKML